MNDYFYANASDPKADEFDAWMRKVDDALVSMCGLGVLDLPDVMYHDYFDDGLDPEYAAELCLEYAKELL